MKSSKKYEEQDNKKLIYLELNDNPLLTQLDDDTLTEALDAILVPLGGCLNRAYKATFPGDPSLEVGDYVRLTGGAIDTKRGYATGMITQQTWRYGGRHEIRCNMPASISSTASGISTYAADEVSAQESVERVQPKSQVEKELDEIKAQVSEAQKVPIATTSSLGVVKIGDNLMIDDDGTLSAVTSDDGVSFIKGTYHNYFAPSSSGARVIFGGANRSDREFNIFNYDPLSGRTSNCGRLLFQPYWNRIVLDFGDGNENMERVFFENRTFQIFGAGSNLFMYVKNDGIYPLEFRNTDEKLEIKFGHGCFLQLNSDGSIIYKAANGKKYNVPTEEIS